MIPLHSSLARACHIAGIAIITATCPTAFTYAQDKIYPIKTTAKPEHLKTYEVSTADGQINLLFTKKGKKNEVYTNYVFDKDLHLVTETEEELDVEQVKKKSTRWTSTGFTSIGSVSGIIRDSVLSVDNSILGGLVLKNGYIGWTTQPHPMDLKKEITSVGFVSREKVKVKDDATGRKLTMVGFQTDAPAEFFSTGKSARGDFATNMGRMGSGGDKRVSSATGDVMVISTINTIGLKDEATGEKIFGKDFRFVAQRYSAKTLEKIAETPFEFKYSTKKLYDQPAADESNDMLLIFAPTHGGTKPYHNPNKNEYEYLRVSVDTKIKERIKFNSPYGRLNNLYIYNFGDETIILGTSKAGNESKYADFIAFKGNDDHLVVIRLKNGKEAVVKAIPMKGLGLDISRLAANDALKTADNQVWITGQAYEQKDGDPAKWGNIYAFNIAADGSIAKHLVLPQIEKKSEQGAVPVSLTKLNDGSLLWNTYEYTKKGNMYPKYAKITNGNLGTVVFPGDRKYVVNDAFSFYVSPDVKYLLYFGNTEDNKQFWLHKEEL